MKDRELFGVLRVCGAAAVEVELVLRLFEMWGFQVTRGSFLNGGPV